MRWRSVLLTASSVVALAACGGDEEGRQTVTGPTIDGAVADRLASRSENVAAKLDAGDSCAAKKEAAGLERDFQETVGEIPEVYLEDLGSAIHELVAAIPPCEPPPLPPTTSTETGDGGDGDD